MPFNLLELSSQVRQMGGLLAQRRADDQRRLELLDALLYDYRDRWEELAELAETVQERVAVPTGPLDERVPPHPRPPAYTAMATDGAEIDPDRHGGSGDFYLINVGRARIPYGQPEREVELRSASTLGYTDEDLYIDDPRDPRRQVPMRDRHLDALRTVEELRALADLAEAEVADQARVAHVSTLGVVSPGNDFECRDTADRAEQRAGRATGRNPGPAVPVVALVDGTLLFSVLE